MGKGIVCIGDHCMEAVPHFCITGSSNVYVNSKQVCRQGDSFTEGRVLSEGSKTVFVNGYGVGRVGDLVSCGSKVIRGSFSVFAS